MKVRLESNDMRLILDTTLEEFIESMGYVKKDTIKFCTLESTNDLSNYKIRELKEEVQKWKDESNRLRHKVFAEQNNNQRLKQTLEDLGYHIV